VQPYEFFSYEVELLETLSAAASISFRRLAANEEARTAQNRLERLFNILQALLIAQTRDQVLSLILDDVQDLLATDALVFYDAKASSRGEDADSPWQAEPRCTSDIPLDFRLPGELLARTVGEGPQTFHTKTYAGTRSLRRLYPYALATSLRVEREVLGGMLLLNRTDPALRINAEDRLRLCETVAEQLARAFQDLDLAEEKARLERAVPAMISVSLASGMVHEIGTQADIGLNTLVPLRRAAVGNLNPAQRNQLGDSIAAFEKIGKLASEYLNFGRPVQHAVEIRSRFESINTVVRDTLYSLRYETRDALLDTDLDPSLDRPHTFLDPKFLSLAIGNLVINAVRWVQEGGKISVSTAKRGDGFVVRVEDWGPGVEEDARDKIFEAFYSRSKGGFGLGLTISRYIVRELHGGTLRLVVPRHPTTFEIFLRNKMPQEAMQ
jgi:signal transduction histidine kinase